VLFASNVHDGDRLSIVVNCVGSPIPSSDWISVEYLTSDTMSSADIAVYLIIGGDVSGILGIIVDL
jgi:hypothetical protein